MEIEEAIQKAIEGGYEFEGMRIDPNDGERYIPSEFQSDVFLDPSFWESLGTTLGWIDAEYPNGSKMCSREKCDTRYCEYAGYRNPVDQWHRFIDHLADGKTAESYFEAFQ